VKMKIKKANLKRLASLSALGAGALGIATGTAEASSIVFSGILNERIGFGKGFGRGATIGGPNGAGGQLMRSSLRTSYAKAQRVNLTSFEHPGKMNIPRLVRHPSL